MIAVPLLVEFLAVAIVLWAFVPPACVAFARRIGLVRTNFRGDRLPVAGGLTYLFIAGPLWAVQSLALNVAADSYLLAGVGFGLLGFADDRWGSRRFGGQIGPGSVGDRGFRGHLRALRSGRVTTGALKLIGGAVVALVVAFCQPTSEPAVLRLGDALLIALAANAVNLFDLRPGRAQAGFVALLLLSVIGAALRLPRIDEAIGPAVVLLGAVVRGWRADASGTVMMGDCGANLLGATAGLTAVYLLPVVPRLALLAALAALNLAAERVSLSRVIDSVPLLRAVDRRLGVR